MKFDLRLIDIDLELSALQDQYSIIKSNVERLVKEEHEKIENQKKNTTI